MKLGFVCPILGQASEVWMWRQLCGFMSLKPYALARYHDNQDLYPIDDIPVTYLKHQLRCTSLASRTIRKLRDILIINRWIKNTCPDVALVHYGTLGVRMAPFFHRAGIPTVVHFNGFDLSKGLSNDRYRTQLAKNSTRLAAAIVVADYMKENLVNLGFPASKIHTIPYGVPIDHFRVLRESVRLQPCRFLAVGRLVAKKAPLHLIRAFSCCVEQCNDVTLDILGDGPLRQDAETLAQRLNVANRVTFHGVASNEKVREMMSLADVFVQHSMTAPDGDQEGWPVSIAEAAASSLSIVATRHAGIVTQVIEGSTGFLVDEGDWRAMGDRMARLASDPEFRNRMGEASRVHILNFDIHRQIARLEEVLIQIAKSGGQP